MQGLDLKQKIGQMLVFGWQGATDEENYTVSEHGRTLIDEFQVGGIALFARNISTPEQVAATVNEFQSRSGIPLLVVADQEGGMVARFKAPFAVFPGNMALGATGSPDYCKRAAQAIAKQLAAVGVNVNFAPCVDVNINPENPIIGVRSFGESPEMVAQLGAAAIEGFQMEGIMASAKHFPGHGDTSTDTHFSLPIIPYDRKRLDLVELVPFRAAIRIGVASVMTSHIIFPALDPELPATLSARIINGLLREEMGYDGLVVTDCLEMKAITDNYGAANSAILAVKAGADILLASHRLGFQRDMRDGLLKAVESGDIPESRIDESVTRIMNAKRLYDLESRRQVDVAAIKSAIGDPVIIELEREIAEKAVTLVRNEDNLLPLRLPGSAQMAVVGMHPATELFASAIRKLHANTQHLRIESSPSKEQLAQLDALVQASKAVLITTFPREPFTTGLVNEEVQASLVNRIIDLGVPTIVVAAREPYGLRHFPKAKTCIVTYGYPEVSIRAAVDLIFGLVEPYGKLPVSVPGYADCGDGA